MNKGGLALRYAAWFFGMIALFTVSMTLAYCIPQEALAFKQETSVDILDMEHGAFGNFFGVDPGRLDNQTDSLMIDQVLPADSSMSPLEAAMSVNDYSRYWHGYMVFLRPLLIKLNLWQIRYVNMFAFFLLTGGVFLMIDRKLSGGYAFAFLASLIACYIVIVPMSLQYNSVFLVLLCAMLFLLLRYERMTPEGAPLFFMVVGMITNFLDFLTAPLLTLGMPLLLLLELDMHRQERTTLAFLLKRLVLCSVAWGAGYALCWVSKWIIGSLVLGESVFDSAGDHAAGWLANNWGQYGRLYACQYNFWFFFLIHGKRVYLPLIIPAVAYAICLFRFPAKNVKNACILLPVCLYPYLWYMVMTNHSLFHTWFTNRLQAMTLFGALMFMIELVDWKRCKEALGRRMSR